MPSAEHDFPIHLFRDRPYRSTTTVYLDHVFAELPAAATKYLKDAMTAGNYDFRTDFVGRPYRDGQLDAVLVILDTREIRVTRTVFDQIASCPDLEQARMWVRRAVTVSRAEDLFD